MHLDDQRHQSVRIAPEQFRLPRRVRSTCDRLSNRETEVARLLRTTLSVFDLCPVAVACPAGASSQFALPAIEA